MVFQLVEKDPALRALPFVAGFGIILGLSSTRASHNVVAVITTVLFGLLASVVPHIQLSTMRFLESLPIRVRDVYAANVLVMAVLVWLPIMTAGYWIKGIAPLQMASFATFILLILQSASIRRARLNRVQSLAPLAILGAVPIISLDSPAWLSLRFSWSLLAAGAVLFSWTWKTLPPSFLLSAEKSHPSAGVPDVVVRRTRPGWRDLFILYPPQYVWWTLAVAALSAFSNWGSVAYISLALTSCRASIRWASTLPISRRLLLHALIVPLLLSALVGLAIHEFAPWNVATYFYKVVQDDDGACADKIVAMPLKYWERSGSAAGTVIRAPWGETAEAPALSVFGVDFYNPYQAGCNNTPGFFAWQRGRANAARLNHPFLWRLVFLDSAMLLFLTLLGCGVTLFYSWPRVRHLHPLLRMVPLAASGLCWLAAAFLPIFINAPMYENAVVCLSWILPGYWVAAALVPAFLTYVATDKLFRETEFRNQQRVAAS